MSSGALRGLFLLEGVFLGLGAGLAGALIGGGIVYYYSVHGIDLSAAAKGQGDFAFSTMLYLSFGWSAIGRAITFSLGISLIASVYPAIRAASLNPADAVRAD
jgi:ABC-type antimicrobial peptide transport system permease subunit